MKIEVTDQALQWFKDEVGLEEGSMVKFIVRIYGTSSIQENYSLGFNIDDDVKSDSISTEKDDITFYVNQEDLWFFKDKNLRVVYDESRDEVDFEYVD